MAAATPMQTQAVMAFDNIAARYDEVFTRTLIGRAQRDAVWQVLIDTFEAGSYILELNCGTGEDALFLDQHDISVLACDASPEMIRTARHRLLTEAPQADIEFRHLAIEQLNELTPQYLFEGALSNFSGLNCVADLGRAARHLAALMAPGAPLVICLSTRFCVMETLWFLMQGQLRKAFRRAPGYSTAHVDGFAIQVYYPRLGEVKRLFAPWFRLLSCTGVGVAVPPSYLEPVVRRYPWLLPLCKAIDLRIAGLPLLRTVGDHMLLRFERRGGACC